MRIQDLESRTGMERATIRFYERQGMITPNRLENGYRDYSEEDASQLLKIKLLRQLDFPLEKIQELQQGTTSVSEAMAQQILFLKGKADATLRASDLCHEMLKDGVEYSTLNASIYLKLLNDASQKPIFRESIQPENHPIRRFIARYIDWIAAELLVMWIVFSVIRIRPMLSLYTVLVIAISVLLNIYMEAVCTFLFGCTLGKWVMGIRVESANGGKLSWEEALWRAKLVMQEGCGFQIPVWNAIRCYLGYRGCTEGRTLTWEEDTELQFKPWNLKGKIALGLVYVILIAGASAIGLDAAYYPSYRGSHMTMDRFVKNFNGYAREGSSLNNAWANETMREKGDFDILPSIKVDYIRQSPTYTYDETGILARIEFTGKMEYDQEVIEHLILAVAGAQKDAALMELVSLKAGTTVNQEIRRQISFDKTSGKFTVAGIQVTWTYDPDTKNVSLVIPASP